jgi:hypothetical protein
MFQRDAALWAGCKRIEATGEYIALRRFREPPVLIFFRRDQRLVECCEGGGRRAKAAHLLGDSTSHERVKQIEDDDECEDEDSLPR